jgi:hypothetical protein
MNDIVKTDLKVKIAELLLNGESVDRISTDLDCPASLVMSIQNSADFLSIISEQFEKESKIKGLKALRNIADIMDNPDSSQATQLKASIWLADNAKDMAQTVGEGDTEATMTQEQLARRLTEIQKELIKRSKPVNGFVIEHKSPSELEDMMHD